MTNTNAKANSIINNIQKGFDKLTPLHKKKLLTLFGKIQ